MGAAQEKTLARKAQAGSSAAASALADSNIRLVVYLVGKIRRPEWIPIDDLVQEGVLGLMHAIRLFNPNLGRFRPYAKRWILDYAYKFIERASHQSCSPLDGLEPTAPEDGPESLLIAAEARHVTSRVVGEATRTLAPKEAATIAGRLAGASTAEIGRRLGCTHQNVSLINKTARAKVARLLRRDRRVRSIF